MNPRVWLMAKGLNGKTLRLSCQKENFGEFILASLV
jgi:hypothetical protein